MEKTTHIILAGIRLEMTSEAFDALDAYLKSLGVHFDLDPDKAEIIRDIEARIAEKFTQSGEAAITLPTVQAMVRQMGLPEDLNEDEAHASVSSVRKLYRDMDNAILGGVGSGIAAYFGIDPIIVRLTFIGSVFLGGAGIMLYILLWLLLPPARTASHKLEMRGSAVTLRTMEKQVRATSTALSQNGLFRKAVYFPFEVAGSLIRGIGRFMPVMGKLFGIGIALGSFFAILGITTFALLAAFNMNTSFIETPLLDAVSPLILYGLMLALYMSATIPLVFLLILAQKLVHTHARISPAIGFGLIGIWSIAVIASGVLGFRTANDYSEHLQNSPLYQEVTAEIPLETFKSVAATRGAELRIATGAVQKATITAAKRDQERISARVENEVLFIETRPINNNCIFCEFRRPVVTITVPTLESIKTESGSRVRFDDFQTDTLTIDGDGGYISGDLTVGTLIIDGEDLSLDLAGSASSTSYRLSGASVSAHKFEVQSVSIELYDYSHAALWAVEALDAYADKTSDITYRGEPAQVSGNAVSEKAEDQETEEYDY